MRTSHFSVAPAEPGVQKRSCKYQACGKLSLAKPCHRSAEGRAWGHEHHTNPRAHVLPIGLLPLGRSRLGGYRDEQHPCDGVLVAKVDMQGIPPRILGELLKSEGVTGDVISPLGTLMVCASSEAESVSSGSSTRLAS